MKSEYVDAKQFGYEWGKMELPIEAVVGAIDNDGYNTELYRIGLSAMQLDNLEIKRRSPPLNIETLQKVIERNNRGLLDDQDYGELVVEYNGRHLSAQVYNAFGPRGFGGPRVRISSILAEDLGLKVDDRVKLYK